MEQSGAGMGPQGNLMHLLWEFQAWQRGTL